MLIKNIPQREQSSILLLLIKLNLITIILFIFSLLTLSSLISYLSTTKPSSAGKVVKKIIAINQIEVITKGFKINKKI